MGNLEGHKQLSFTVPEELFIEIKHLAIDHRVKVKEFCITALKRYIQDYCQNDERLIIEPVNEEELTEEERKSIEEGRRDIEEGRCMSFDDYMKGRL